MMFSAKDAQEKLSITIRNNKFIKNIIDEILNEIYKAVYNLETSLLVSLKKEEINYKTVIVFYLKHLGYKVELYGGNNIKISWNK